MRANERSYQLELDSASDDDQVSAKAATCKSQSQSMFQFLKRRIKPKAKTPSRNGSVDQSQDAPQDQNVSPQSRAHQPNEQKCNVLAMDKPSMYTFASNLQSPLRQSKLMENSLPQQSLHSEPSLFSLKSKATVVSQEDHALTTLFAELSDRCNSFAQSGVNYKSSTQELITQALQLTKTLQDPSSKKKHSHLRTCWTTVQNMFRQFQAMDASQTVNSLRLAVKQHIRNELRTRRELELAIRQDAAVQANDGQLQYLQQCLEQANNNVELLRTQCQLKQKQFTCLAEQQVGQAQQQKQGLLASIEQLKRQLTVVQHALHIERLLSEKLKAQSNRRQELVLKTTDRTELYRAEPEGNQAGSQPIEEEAVPSLSQAGQTIRRSQRSSNVCSAPPSFEKGRLSDLTHQLHTTAEQLYSYWSALRSIQQTLVALRLYHKVSDHYSDIRFNERLYL